MTQAETTPPDTDAVVEVLASEWGRVREMAEGLADCADRLMVASAVHPDWLGQ